MPNFIKIEKTSCGWMYVRMYTRTYVHMDGQTFVTGVIMSTLSKSRHNEDIWLTAFWSIFVLMSRDNVINASSTLILALALVSKNFMLYSEANFIPKTHICNWFVLHLCSYLVTGAWQMYVCMIMMMMTTQHPSLKMICNNFFKQTE